jgi:aryl-alcohol dehydrogenase-like predicted oxidoreductase
MRALDDQVRLGKVLYPAVSDWAAWEIAEANTAARLRDWSPFTAVQLRYNLLDRSPERELLPMADACDLPVFAWGPLAEGRLTGKYLNGHTGRATEVGRAYTRVGSDDIVRDVVAISHPADVMRDAAVIAGVYGAQLPDIDDPRAQAVRRTTAGT